MTNTLLIRSKKTGLLAPLAFWRTPEDERRATGGRCGPGTGFIEKLVPETAYGLSLTPACEIHDFMWAYLEKSEENRAISDRTFLSNMLTIIDRNTRWGWLKWLRKRRAYKYYEAVSNMGGIAYYRGQK